MTKIDNLEFIKSIDQNCCLSPAFIYDEVKIIGTLTQLRDASAHCQFKTLFPIKSFGIIDGLFVISSHTHGLSVSSLFEARLARSVITDSSKVHVTTPGIRPNEVHEISHLCDFISFNSLSHFARYYDKIRENISGGLRINPQLSFVEDKRYDPCGKYSKLGVPLNTLSKLWKNDPKSLVGLEGMLIHSNCESKDLNELSKTVFHIEKNTPGLFNQLKWINLGGGYIFETSKDLSPLTELVSYLNNRYDVEVFFEPGKAIVGSAGYIISTVLDLFESDGKTIAVLDASVNHMPEVFEYQSKPKVFGAVKNSKYKFILAGCTCLAGDVFGEYSFKEPLQIGSRVIFENVGAYTLVKAHMFNGVNLPDIYALTLDGKLELKKRFTYEEFLQRCGGWTFETKRKAVIDS